MEISNFVSKIKNLVAENDLEQAIVVLRNFMDSNKHFNEIIIQSARYNDIESQIRMNIVSKIDADIEKNKIRLAILQVTDNIQKYNDKEIIEKKIISNEIIIDNIIDTFVKNSINSIKQRMITIFDLLREYENDYIFANEPKIKMKYKKEINDLKMQIESAEQELKDLKNNYL